jgi:hypothetical protein
MTRRPRFDVNLALTLDRVSSSPAPDGWFVVMEAIS